MIKFICNAFSFNMLANLEEDFSVEATKISAEAAAIIAKDAPSAVGHVDTAAIFSTVLGIPVPAARVTVALEIGDSVLIGQYQGPRLPEGATQLPEGSKIVWLVAEIMQ